MGKAPFPEAVMRDLTIWLKHRMGPVVLCRPGLSQAGCPLRGYRSIDSESIASPSPDLPSTPVWEGPGRGPSMLISESCLSQLTGLTQRPLL